MKYIKIAAILFLFFSATIIYTNIVVFSKCKFQIYEKLEETPSRDTVLILGARVYSNGKMSSVLLDRVKTGMELYKKGRASKILLSGDHGTNEYDEVKAMKDYLVLNNVKEEDIFMDHAGFDTYDSMYRARDVFEVRSMIVVTQEFHLVRAVYTARELGIDAVGLKADKQNYLYMTRNNIRETLARVKAYFDITFNSKPKFLGEVIDITGDGRESWD